MATKNTAREPTRPPGEGFSKESRPPRRQPVALDLGGATAEQIAQAIFATAKPPDPSKRRRKRR